MLALCFVSSYDSFVSSYDSFISTRFIFYWLFKNLEGGGYIGHKKKAYL